MRKKQSRMPKLGDLIVEYCDESVHCGIVADIKLGKYGHQENVFIHWSGNEPKVYNRKHGYSGINIHNLRSRYDLIREGKKVK